MHHWNIYKEPSHGTGNEVAQLGKKQLKSKSTLWCCDQQRYLLVEEALRTHFCVEAILVLEKPRLHICSLYCKTVKTGEGLRESNRSDKKFQKMDLFIPEMTEDSYERLHMWLQYLKGLWQKGIVIIWSICTGKEKVGVFCCLVCCYFQWNRGGKSSKPLTLKLVAKRGFGILTSGSFQEFKLMYNSSDVDSGTDSGGSLHIYTSLLKSILQWLLL